MIVGIVGSEEVKFTELGKQNALHYIRQIVADPEVTEVVSGGCHLGGIDIWAEEIAKEYNKKMTVFLPTGHYWSTGFKPRNEKIANKSDIVYCITVDKLPENYNGMKFDLCYHCERNSVISYPDHVKSGGCWTMYYAIDHGKKGKLIVVHNY
jgi:hypothetical protein